MMTVWRCLHFCGEEVRNQACLTELDHAQDIYHRADVAQQIYHIYS